MRPVTAEADLSRRYAVTLRTTCSAHTAVARVYVLTGVQDTSTLGALHATRRHLCALDEDLYVRRYALVDALCVFAKSAVTGTVHMVACVTLSTDERNVRSMHLRSGTG